MIYCNRNIFKKAYVTKHYNYLFLNNQTEHISSFDPSRPRAFQKVVLRNLNIKYLFN